MTPHILADLFPLLEGDELNALRDDIAEQGLREPIVTFEGKVLDGRNRLRACELAHVEPRFEELPSGTNPTAFVISKNLARRHLTVSQRALIAAQLANMRVGRPAETASKDAISQSEAADRLSVSRSSVQRATHVVENAVPEVVAAVKAGELKLHRASEIADLPASEQVAAIEPPPNPPPSKPRIDARVQAILDRQAARPTKDIKVTKPMADFVGGLYEVFSVQPQHVDLNIRAMFSELGAEERAAAVIVLETLCAKLAAIVEDFREVPK